VAQGFVSGSRPKCRPAPRDIRLCRMAVPGNECPLRWISYSHPQEGRVVHPRTDRAGVVRHRWRRVIDWLGEAAAEAALATERLLRRPSPAPGSGSCSPWYGTGTLWLRAGSWHGRLIPSGIAG
jgi:hypothetical protein